MKDLATEAECRIIYLDIINGCSPVNNLYIRHNTEIQNCLIEVNRKRYFDESGKKGLLSEKDKLELLDKKGHWTQREESEYKDKQEEIDSMRFSLKKLVIPQQIKHLEGEIEKKEQALKPLTVERLQLLGMTKEYYANKKAQEEHILSSFFNDSKLERPYFSSENDDIHGSKLDTYFQLYREIHEVFTERNFKRIAVCPFFLNSFMLCGENAGFFFNKPIMDITIYQLSLLNKGNYYKGLLSDPEIKSPPEEYYENVGEVVKWFDTQYSLSLSRRSNNQLTSRKS